MTNPIQKEGEHESVCYVITGLGVGGAEGQVLDLANELSSRSWRVSILSLLPFSDDARTCLDSRVSLATLGMRRGVANPGALLSFRRYLRRERPSLIHSHMLHANFLARVGNLLSSRRPLISTIHNVEEGAAWGMAMYRVTGRLAEITSHVSNTGLQKYVRRGAISPDRAVWIPNGVDLNRLRTLPDARATARQELQLGDRMVWTCVASFSPQKNHPLLLQAWQQVVKRDPSALLLLVGDGPEQGVTRGLAETLELTESVRFLGTRPDVSSLLAASDGFVLSSDWEGFPIVLLEAAAARLPVVATDVGGVQEIVLSDTTGVLVPPRDVDALAAAVCKVMELGPDGRSAMAERARRHVEENFDLQRVADKWQEIYIGLLTD
jgi:glycosyltransferase involved in cell wall biosynthesis